MIFFYWAILTQLKFFFLVENFGTGAASTDLVEQVSQAVSTINIYSTRIAVFSVRVGANIIKRQRRKRPRKSSPSSTSSSSSSPSSSSSSPSSSPLSSSSASSSPAKSENGQSDEFYDAVDVTAPDLDFPPWESVESVTAFCSADAETQTQASRADAASQTQMTIYPQLWDNEGRTRVELGKVRSSLTLFLSRMTRIRDHGEGRREINLITEVLRHFLKSVSTWLRSKKDTGARSRMNFGTPVTSA